MLCFLPQRLDWTLDTMYCVKVALEVNVTDFTHRSGKHDCICEPKMKKASVSPEGAVWSLFLSFSHVEWVSRRQDRKCVCLIFTVKSYIYHQQHFAFKSCRHWSSGIIGNAGSRFWKGMWGYVKYIRICKIYNSRGSAASILIRSVYGTESISGGNTGVLFFADCLHAQQPI